MNYQQLKQKHQDELRDFEGIFFAFSEKQYRKGVEKVGASKDNKIVRLPGGGFILKSRLPAFKEMFARHETEKKAFKKDRSNLLDALVYELCNHEYCITFDESDALEALGLETEDLPEGVLATAKRRCLAMSS